MSDVTVTIAGVSGTATFTNAQAEKFIPPLLRRHNWVGETVWASMTVQQRQDACTFVAKLLLWEAVKVARTVIHEEGSNTGASTAVTDYDGTIGGPLLTRPQQP